MRRIRLSLAIAFFAPAISAQIESTGLSDRDLGLPPHPPLITFLGIGTPGKWATDPSLFPSGRLVQVDYEELAVNGAASPLDSQTIKFRGTEHPVELIQTHDGTTVTTFTKYEDARIVSRESTLSNKTTPPTKLWEYWKYDTSGKLMDYRRGRGDTIESHLTNFKRDAQGRTTSYEFHQQSADKLLSRTEYQYSSDGNTIQQNDYYEGNAQFRSLTETLDAHGNVSKVSITEWNWKTKKPRRTLTVALRYDAQNRLIEQSTEPYKHETDGLEFELPPGKVTVVYDDTLHTRVTSYHAKVDTMTSTVTLNAAGAVLAQSFDTGPNAGTKTHLECIDDDRGNWIRCDQMAISEGITKTTHSYRRTIRYLQVFIPPSITSANFLHRTPAAPVPVISADPASPNFAGDVIRSANTYQSTGDAASAEAYLSQAELMQERANIVPISRMPILLVLDSFYQENRQYPKLETIRTKILANWAAAVGEDELVVANACERLAVALTNEGKLEQAEPLWNRAIRIIRNKLGGNDPAVEWAMKKDLDLQERIQATDEMNRTKDELLKIRKALDLSSPFPANLERVGGTVKAPKALNRVEPVYTEEARKAHLGGSVLLALVVGTDGKASHVQILQPIGMGLDETASKAVQSWLFDPATKNGVPVPVPVTVEVSFRLQ